VKRVFSTRMSLSFSRRGGESSGSSASPNVLKVSILEARSLVEGERKAIEPYVVVRYAGQVFKTRTVKRNHPRVTWDERVGFIAPSTRVMHVRFQVLDRASGSHLGLGMVGVNTVRELRQDFIQKRPASRSLWLTLTDKHGTAGDFGRLRVVISFEHQNRVSGKTRLALYSRVGLNRSTRGARVDELEDDDEDGELFDSEEEEDAVEPASEASDSDDIVPDEDPESSEKNAEKIQEDFEEERKRRKEEEEAFQARLEAAQKIELKPGAWRVVIHVIELRELHPEDWAGTSDPVCVATVEVPQRKPVKASSSIFKSVRSCVVDEQLFLDLKDMDESLLQAANIRFAVWDADVIANDLIGTFVFNLLDVYYSENHSQDKVWVGLIDEKNPKDKGVQGYARLSICVLGPGDSVPVLDAFDGEEEEIGEVLLPPSIRTELHFLRIAIFKAEDLPALDTRRLAGTDGIDAFLTAEFEGSKISTRVVSATRQKRSTDSLRCVFNEELWLPTFNPRLAKNVFISLLDRDRTSSNDLVGTLLLNFQDVLSSRRHRIGPKWVNFYGCRGRESNSAAKEMNRNPSLATAYRGRILVALRDYLVDEEDDKEKLEAAHKMDVRPIRRGALPPSRKYTLRLWAIAGADLAKTELALVLKSRAPVALVLSVGPHKASTCFVTPKSGGIATWVEKVEMEVDLPAELLGRWEHPQVQQMVRKLDEIREQIATTKAEADDQELRLRSRPGRKNTSVSRLDILERQESLIVNWILRNLEDAQVPDIFLYLELQKDRAVSYLRFKPGELLLKRFDSTPSWLNPLEDKASDLLDDDDFPGSVLASVGFGSVEDAQATSAAWDENLMRTYDQQQETFDVHINIFQAAELPSADKNSLSDPYGIVRFRGLKKKLTKRFKTCDPVWNEKIVFTDVTLPPAAFSPLVAIELWDFDAYDPDDRLGFARFPIVPSGVTRYPGRGSIEWRPVFLVSQGDCGNAAVLASVDVLPAGSSHQESPSLGAIGPTESDFGLIQIAVLGLRNIESFQGIPIQNPLVEFHLGDASKTRNIFKTKRSNSPSGSNPNFGQLIEIPFRIPGDLVFLPRLQISVKESRLGGLSQPLVASSALDLIEYVPGSPFFRPSEGAIPSPVGHNPNMATSPQENTEAELASFLAPVEGEGQEPVDEEMDTILEEDFEGASKIADSALETEEPQEEDEDSEGSVSDESLQADVEEWLEWPGHDPLPLPAFMKGRKTVTEELEAELGNPPFESFPLFRGQAIRKNFFGVKKQGNLRQVGTLKAVVRILRATRKTEIDGDAAESGSVFSPEMIDKLLKPQQVEVRLNVLKGFNFIPLDIGQGKSDPYMVVKLGKQKVDDEKNYILNATNPEFYRSFVLRTQLPGESILKITCMDYDTFSRNDLIGETLIDLEDRFLSARWHQVFAEENAEERRKDEVSQEDIAKGVIIEESQDANLSNVEKYTKKPVEMRSLYSKTSQLEQGKLELWVDLMSEEQALEYPLVDVAPPPDTLYELRVIIWKSANVPAFDSITKMNDLYVRAQFGKKWMSTDTHLRCKKGAGSWNYRLKWSSLKLPLKRLESRLSLQIWDRDFTKYSDLIAETTLDLSQHLRSVFLRGDERYQVFSDEARRLRRRNLPVSTKPEKIQPSGPVRMPSEISIDPYTGIPCTNADADDIASQISSKRVNRSKKSKKTKKKNLSPGDDEEDLERKEETRDLISEYLPFGAEALSFSGPPNSKALDLYFIDQGVKKDMGQLWVSIELVKQSSADTTLANGSGRNEPNRFPKLPKPVGRLNWMRFWNPFYLMTECLGPSVAAKCCAGIVCVLAIVITVLLFPQVSSFVSLINSLPHGIGYILVALVGLAVVVCCCMCAASERKRRQQEEKTLQAAYDLEAQQYVSAEASDNSEDVKNCCDCCGRGSKMTTAEGHRRIQQQQEEDEGILHLE